jgi:phosphoadenosine phosphosulfate reductase
MTTQEKIQVLSEKTKGMTPQEVLKIAFDEFGSKISFATSLGEEDQVITDMIAKNAPGIEVFTLDTGRLFPETYELLAKTQKKYNNINLTVYYPNTQAVEEMVKTKGINLFYESVANRQTCCGVRKVEPLRRALSKVDAWITGLRRAQSLTRTDAQVFEYDAANGKIKINPLIDWSLDQVRDYLKNNNVDVSPLHATGFVSIGCQPCTRAIKEGEDIRAGRWWWEQPESKECGLHNNPKWKGNKK